MFRLKLKESLKNLKKRETVWQENFTRKIYIILRALHMFIQMILMHHIYQYYSEGISELITGGCITLFLQIISLGLALILYKRELYGIIHAEIIILACSFLEYTIETIFIARKFSQREEQERLYYTYQKNDLFFQEITSIRSLIEEPTINPSEAYFDSVIIKALNLTLSLPYLNEIERSEKIDKFINGFNETISNSNLSEQTTDIFNDFTVNFIFLCLVIPFFINMLIQLIIIFTLFHHRFINSKKLALMKDNQENSHAQHTDIFLRLRKINLNFLESLGSEVLQPGVKVKDGVNRSSSDKSDQKENINEKNNS